MSEQRFARVAGLGRYLPSRVVTNDDLARIVDTSDEWIRSRTGIGARRFAAEGESTSSMAAAAAREALCGAGIEPETVDLVMVATSTPDFPLFPSTSCLVQEALGLTNAGAFDLSAACSGFVYGLITASQFIQTGAYQRILLIGADTMSRYLDFTDRGTCVLFGDGAGAAVLVATEEPGGLQSFILGADGSGGPHLIVPIGGSREPVTADSVAAGGTRITMNGREVYRFSTTVPADALQRAAACASTTIGELDLVVAHQANVRILQTVAKNLGVPESLFYTNVEHYGNTSAATVPLALYDAREDGRLTAGDRIGFMGFGGGLTWATAIWGWHGTIGD